MRAPLILITVLLPLLGCGTEPPLTTRSPEALQSYLTGLSEYQKFYYSEAKAAFEQALAHDSTFAMAWARLAAVRFSLRDERAARADIEKAIRHSRNATLPEQLFVRLWNYHLNFAFEDAARVADSLIIVDPGNPEPYFLRGTLFETSKRYDSAIQMYEKALKVDPNFALAVMMLGYDYSNLGEHEKALRYMEQYIKLAPAAADPRASYADLLVRVGRYEEALEQYGKALELKPDYWYAFRETGMIFTMLGRLKEGVQQARRAFELLPQTSLTKTDFLVTDGWAELRRGKYAEAARLFGEALRVDSVKGSAAYGLVTALGRMGRFTSAHEILAGIMRVLERRNLTGSGEMYGYYLLEATLLTDENRLAEARAKCDTALEYSTPLTRTSVYRQIAEIYLRQRSFEAALDACEEALSVNPNSPDGLLTLTRIYAGKRDRAMTQEIGNRLLTLWKDADPDFYPLQELRRMLKGSLPSALSSRTTPLGLLHHIRT